jgi:hypothetical protein
MFALWGLVGYSAVTQVTAEERVARRSGESGVRAWDWQTLENKAGCEKNGSATDIPTLGRRKKGGRLRVCELHESVIGYPSET